MKKLIFRSLFACLLAVTSAPALHATDLDIRYLEVGPEETESINKTAAEQCNALDLEYHEAVLDTLAEIAKVLEMNVEIAGIPRQILPQLAGRLDLLGRHEIAGKVRFHIGEMEAVHRRVCTIA
jgi:hypothetical protein